MGTIKKAVTGNGGILLMAIDSKDMVEEMRRIHHTAPVVTAALGRLLSAASLMGSNLKGEKESITLRVDGKGEIGTMIAVADSLGNGRAYVTNPLVDLPLNAVGKLDVGKAVGPGTLSVIKDLRLKEAQVGQVELVSGEIAEDMAEYFARSEQIPSAVGLGVLVDTDLSVKAAGGFIAQLLPGADETDIERLEKNIAAMPPIVEMFSAGGGNDAVIAAVLDGFSVEILDTFSVSYRCNCSRERTERTLISIGKRDLQSLIEEGEPIDVSCDFCGTQYHFTVAELHDLLHRATRA